MPTRNVGHEEIQDKSLETYDIVKYLLAFVGFSQFRR